MELLEFKNKFLSLCKTENIKDIGEILMAVVLQNDVEFFENYKKIADNTKDWLQALWQYYEADRNEKKQDYTPKSLCKLVSELAGKTDTFYDCCGGSGALTISMLESNEIKKYYIEELDERVIPFLLFNLCLRNSSGYVINGNVLTKEKKKCYKVIKGEKYSTCKIINGIENINARISISNPPYNIKWEQLSPIETMADGRFPVMPPKGNANYAFVFNCLYQAKEKAVLILPCGVMTEQTEIECRKYLINNDLIETVIIMPNHMFEVTTISTCILVLNKNKNNKGKIQFIDSRNNYETEEREQNGQFGGKSHTNRTYKKSYKVLKEKNIKKIIAAIENKEEILEFSTIVNNEQVAENDYILSPTKYIKFDEKETNHRDFQEIADNINYISKMQNSCKLVINETLAKKLGIDVELFKKAKENSKETKKQMKAIGINIEEEDFIQFTKNKNELVFKSNDKELLPDIFIQFLSVWKNQIAMLNTMQNTYLTELRDALLPDLMSGKIDL